MEGEANLALGSMRFLEANPDPNAGQHQGWGVADLNGVLHVLPVTDLYLHEAFDCWCTPQMVEGKVVHNAADGRE